MYTVNNKIEMASIHISPIEKQSMKDNTSVQQTAALIASDSEREAHLVDLQT